LNEGGRGGGGERQRGILADKVEHLLWMLLKELEGKLGGGRERTKGRGGEWRERGRRGCICIDEGERVAEKERVYMCV